MGLRPSHSAMYFSISLRTLFFVNDAGVAPGLPALYLIPRSRAKKTYDWVVEVHNQINPSSTTDTTSSPPTHHRHRRHPNDSFDIMALTVETGTLWLAIMGTIFVITVAALIAALVAKYINRGSVAMEDDRKSLAILQLRVNDVRGLERELFGLMDEVDSMAGRRVPLSRQSRLIQILLDIES